MNRTLQVFNFSVQNAANDAVDIHIDGDIVDASTQAMFQNFLGDDTSVSFKSFRNQVNATPAKTYNIYINSAGGLVTDAMAMHDFIVDLQNQGKTVNTIGRGIVASAATYILMASKNAEMSKNSWFMIHNVSGGFYGSINEMERYVSTLRQFNDRTRDFYAEYTGMSKEAVAKLMDQETFMDADTAEKKGFIKKVAPEAAFTNQIPKEQWQYSNTAVLNAYNSAVKLPQQQDDHKSYIDNKIEDMKLFFSNIVDSIRGVETPKNADAQAIANAIADAMAPHFEQADTELQAQLTAKDEAIKNSITEQIANAVKPFEEKITALEAKNTALEADIANKIGQPVSTPQNNNPEQKPIGKYEND